MIDDSPSGGGKRRKGQEREYIYIEDSDDEEDESGLYDIDGEDDEEIINLMVTLLGTGLSGRAVTPCQSKDFKYMLRRGEGKAGLTRILGVIRSARQVKYLEKSGKRKDGKKGPRSGKK